MARDFVPGAEPPDPAIGGCGLLATYRTAPHRTALSEAAGRYRLPAGFGRLAGRTVSTEYRSLAITDTPGTGLYGCRYSQ